MNQVMKGSSGFFWMTIFLSGLLFSCSFSPLAYGGKKLIIEAEKALSSGGASKVADKTASAGLLASLSKSGHAIIFANLPSASKLAIRHTSMQAGTIGVSVNNNKAIKVNIHFSGALTGSFLNAIIDIKIPADKIDGPVLAVLNRITSGEGDAWKTIKAPIKKISGVHDLFLCSREKKNFLTSTGGNLMPDK